MPKSKSKKTVSVGLHEAHTCECPECFEQFLILDVPEEGDKITCTCCGQKMKVDGIYGDFRDDHSKQELNVIRVML